MSAIEGFVPQDMIRCFTSYLDFCYIARSSVFTHSTLDSLDNALKHFHEYRQVFQRVGVRDPTSAGFSLPRQHAMTHYRRHIENFGAPNGLCSSITESKHISVVKRPWRQSSRYNAIHQIMQTNQRTEKLSAARATFTARGLFNFPTWQPRLPHPVPSDDDEDQCGAAEDSVIHNEVFLPQTHGKTLIPTSVQHLLFQQFQTIRTTSMPSVKILGIQAFLTWSTTTSSSKRRIPPHLCNIPTSMSRTLSTSRSSILHALFFVHHQTHPQPPACTTKQFVQRLPGTEAKYLGHATTVSLSRVGLTPKNPS